MAISGIHVDERRGEPRHLVQQGVPRLLGDAVALAHVELAAHHHLGFRPQGVADPAQPEVADAANPRDGAENRRAPVHELRLDRVHEATEHIPRRRPAHEHDGHGDHQTGDRVGQAETGGDASGTGEHGQRGHAVGAGVQPVGDQGGRADAPTDPDAVLGHPLVPQEPQNGSGGDSAQQLHVLRMQQPVHRLVAGGHRRGGDGRHHGEPGEVLGPAVAVDVAATGRSSPDQERQPERHSRQRVGEVVQRVPEERHRAAHEEHDQLARRRRGQAEQGDAHRPHPLVTALEDLVDLPEGAVGAVRVVHDPAAQAPDPSPSTVVVVGVPVPVAMRSHGGVRLPAGSRDPRRCRVGRAESRGAGFGRSSGTRCLSPHGHG